jgi:hypothetical protein
MSGIRRAVQRSPLAALNGENSCAKVENVRQDSSALPPCRSEHRWTFPWQYIVRDQNRGVQPAEHDRTGVQHSGPEGCADPLESVRSVSPS